MSWAVVIFLTLVMLQGAYAQQPAPTLEDWQAAFNAAQAERNQVQTAHIDAEVRYARAEREIASLKKRIEELEAKHK